MDWQGLRNARAAGLRAGVRFTVTQDNVDDIPAVPVKSVEEGIERFCMYHLVYAGRGTELAPRDLTPACSPHCKTGRRPVGAMEANTP